MFSGNISLLTFWLGILFSLVIAVLAGTLIDGGVLALVSYYGFRPTLALTRVTGWTSALLGLSVGIMHFVAVFTRIPAGMQGRFQFMGVPEDDFILPPGYASKIVIGFFDIFVEKAAGAEIAPDVQKLTTAEGIGLSVAPSALYSVTNASILSQTLQDQDVREFVTNELINQTRIYISKLDADLAPALAGLDEDVKSKERAMELLSKIASLKNGVAVDGRQQIEEGANKKLSKFGLKLSNVQMKGIQLPDAIEQAAEKILEEILQSASVPRDWGNKDDAVRVILNVYKEDADWGALPNEEKIRLIGEAFENVMGGENQAKIVGNRWSFRGKPPTGMMLAQEERNG